MLVYTKFPLFCNKFLAGIVIPCSIPIDLLIIIIYNRSMPIPDTYVGNVIIHFPSLEQFYCSLES